MARCSSVTATATSVQIPVSRWTTASCLSTRCSNWRRRPGWPLPSSAFISLLSAARSLRTCSSNPIILPHAFLEGIAHVQNGRILRVVGWGRIVVLAQVIVLDPGKPWDGERLRCKSADQVAIARRIPGKICAANLYTPTRRRNHAGIDGDGGGGDGGYLRLA